MLVTPARQLVSGSHGAYSWWLARGRAEVPEDRVAVAAEQDEAGVLVPRPLADVRARDVADVVRVEEEQRAEIGRGQRGPARSSRSRRSRGKSTRCSQSTAIVAPREAMVMSALLSIAGGAFRVSTLVTGACGGVKLTAAPHTAVTPISSRTIRAPSTSALSFILATIRASGFMPQSVVR